MWGIILALCQAARLGVCFSSLSCIFRDLLWSHWSMLCKRYILKVRLWEQFMERSVFFFPSLFAFTSSVKVPTGCLGWQVEKVPKWPQCCWPIRVTRKWKSSKDCMKNDTSENAAELQMGPGRLFLLVYSPQAAALCGGTERRTPLKVTLVTEPIKTKTSQTCLESNLSRTRGHFTQVWNCETLPWQQQSFSFFSPASHLHPASSHTDERKNSLRFWHLWICLMSSYKHCNQERSAFA